MNMRKAAGVILLVILVGAAGTAALLGFNRSHVEGAHAALEPQSPDVWRARQALVWEEADAQSQALLEHERQVAEAAQAEEDADIAAIGRGDQEAMLRQSDREDQLIQSIISGCDPAVAAQLEAVTELAWPLAGPMKITSPYGERMHPIIGEEAFHRGVDLVARYGSPVLAAAAGVVLYTGRQTTYGNMVVVLHGNGVATVYGHLWKFAVHPYELVQQGQLLGYSGNTGFSTGPHLHFEVRQDGQATNPLEWLPPIETTQGAFGVR